MSEVVVLKIVGGDEIIVTEEVEGQEILYSKPRMIQIHATQKGMQAGLVPWILSAPDETISISHTHIIARTFPTSDIEKAYRQQTSVLDLSLTNQ